MENNYNLKGILVIVTLLIITVIIPLSSATLSSLGTFKQGDCINLLQTCDLCTYNNISSITYPNSSRVVGLVTMSKDGTEYSYPFCQTDALGIYVVNGYGDDSGIVTTWNYYFKVTSTGREFSSMDVTIYIFFLLVCLVVTVFSVRLIKSNSIQKDEVTSSELYQMKKKHKIDFYLNILKKKMWIVGLFGIYLSILMFLSFLNQLVYSLGISEINSLLNNTVLILGWGLVPFVIFWLGYIVIYVTTSSVDILKHQFGSLGGRER